MAREGLEQWRAPGAYVGLTPQGLVRDSSAALERVSLVAPSRASERLAARCDAIVLSRHERGVAADMLRRAIDSGALVAITAEWRPCTILLADGSQLEIEVPAVAKPIDDMGAGDVFAAALFITLGAGERRGRDEAGERRGSGSHAGRGRSRDRGPGRDPRAHAHGPRGSASARTPACERAVDQRRDSRAGAGSRPLRLRGEQQAASHRGHLDPVHVGGGSELVDRTSPGLDEHRSGLERTTDQAHGKPTCLAAVELQPALADDRRDLGPQLTGAALEELARDGVSALGELGRLDRERSYLALGQRLGVDVAGERLDARPARRTRGLRR